MNNFLRKIILSVFLTLTLLLIIFPKKTVFSQSSSFSEKEYLQYLKILDSLLRLFFLGSWTDSNSSPSFSIPSSSFSNSSAPFFSEESGLGKTYSKEKFLKEKVYKAQCDSRWRDFPLPLGCTICKAGCGPTSLAMIVSYFKEEVSPEMMVEIYSQKKAVLGCQGSTLSDAERILRELGFQVGIRKYFFTSDLKSVAQFLLPYIKENWLVLSLANINGIGHFFVIVDIDEAGRIWVLDPYYGNGKTVPLLQNNLPFSVYYRVAVPVKL